MAWRPLDALSAAALLAVTGCQWVFGFEDLPALEADAGDAANAGDASVEPDAPPAADDGMRYVPRQDADGFWMDRREVTRGDYLAFAQDAEANGTAACSWNERLRDDDCEATLGDAARHEDSPMVCVDQCDAQQFCASLDKDLCRGDVVFDADDDWFVACSNGGETTYPFGNAPREEVCNVLLETAGEVERIDQRPRCVNHQGIENLMGNVWEWVGGPGGCDAALGADDACLARGGSFTTRLSSARCDARYNPSRSTTRDDLGLRCCVYPTP